jgi:prophage antirepressor-like protein
MSQIAKYACDELGGAEISCIVVKGEPWFKGVDVASVLGYSRPSDAVYDHVPLKYKNKLRFLIAASRIGKSPIQDVNELNASWICEAGLYKLVLKSRAKHAETFSDWVCSEVLPAIRKTGSYNNTYPYRRDNITKEEVEQLAEGKEDELHYDVVKHIKNRYPDAVLQAGLGEHLVTLHARIDATSKGYRKGQPDLTILRGLPNGFQDVLAVEFKNPDGTRKLKKTQKEYHSTLKNNCNIETVVGHDYDDIILAIHDHYKEVFARAQTPAIADRPEQNYNFATNESPKYWVKKLSNGRALMQECEKRGIPKHEFMIMTNREIASVLITFDKEQKCS